MTGEAFSLSQHTRVSCRSTKYLWFFILLGLIGVCNILALNLVNVPYSDDWCNTVTSFGAGFEKVRALYFHWTGRLYSSILLCVFLYLPPFVIILANIAATFGLVLLCIRLGIGKCQWRQYACYFGLAYTIVWFFSPNFGEVMIWKTGSIVYLWTGVTILAWLVPYRELLFTGDEKLFHWSWRRLVPFALLGFAAGNGIENTSFCAFLMALCVIFWRVKKGLRVPVWAYWGAATCLVGWIILVAAPGNFARANTLPGVSLFQLARRAANIAIFLCANGFGFMLLVPVVLLFLRYRNKFSEFCGMDKHLAVSYLFLFFAMLNMAGLSLAPLAFPRAFSGSFFLALCGLLGIADHLAKRPAFFEEAAHAVMRCTHSTWPVLRQGIGLFLLFFVFHYAYTSGKTFRSYLYEFRSYGVYMQMAAEAKAKGEKTLVLPLRPQKKDVRQFHDGSGLFPDASDWRNQCFAGCYGFESVIQESYSPLAHKLDL